MLFVYSLGNDGKMFRLEVPNAKLGYAVIAAHFGSNRHRVVIHSPKAKSKEYSKLKSSEDIETFDELFGGEGEFYKYQEEKYETITETYKTQILPQIQSV